MNTISSISSKANGILMESNGITNGRVEWIVGIRLSTNRDSDASTKQWCEYYEYYEYYKGC